MDEKLYRSLEDSLEEEVKKIIKKNDISANDLECLWKAFCLMDKCEEKLGMSPSASYGYYGNEMRPYGYDPNINMTYGDLVPNSSFGRMRSPVTGRYISNGMNSGYSGHSIEDRMIAALENQMDNAKTEYERTKIRDEIERIRNTH